MNSPQAHLNLRGQLVTLTAQMMGEYNLLKLNIIKTTLKNMVNAAEEAIKQETSPLPPLTEESEVIESRPAPPKKKRKKKK